MPEKFNPVGIGFDVVVPGAAAPKTIKELLAEQEEEELFVEIVDEAPDDAPALDPTKGMEAPTEMVPLELIEYRAPIWDTSTMADAFRAGWKQIHPVLLRQIGDSYEIIDGIHRIDAQRRAGATRVLSRILPPEISSEEAYVYTLQLNSLRKDNELSQILACIDLCKKGYRIRDISRLTGIAEPTVKRRLWMDRLDPAMFNAVRTGKVALGAAEEARRLSPEAQQRLAILATNRLGSMTAEDLNNPRVFILSIDEVREALAAEAPPTTTATAPRQPAGAPAAPTTTVTAPTTTATAPVREPLSPADFIGAGEDEDDEDLDLPELGKYDAFGDDDDDDSLALLDDETQDELKELLEEKPWYCWAKDLIDQLEWIVPPGLKTERSLIRQLKELVEPRIGG